MANVIRIQAQNFKKFKKHKIKNLKPKFSVKIQKTAEIHQIFTLLKYNDTQKRTANV